MPGFELTKAKENREPPDWRCVRVCTVYTFSNTDVHTSLITLF